MATYKQERLDAFILRAGYPYGWNSLVVWARKMAEQAVAEQDGGPPYGPIDYTLKAGDIVYNQSWGDGQMSLEIVDVNWALKAAAVRLAPRGGIVVWPVGNLSRQMFVTHSGQG
jgi:hypothetical protein